MKPLVEVRAVVRRERLEDVVKRLKQAGVARLTVTRVHAIGSAIDAAAPNISLEEGTAYRDMAVVQCICLDERSEMLVELIAAAAHTGHRGDGIVSVHPVLQVRKIRTAAAGHAALA